MPCVEQYNKKYQTRDSPPFPAQECSGMTMTGNDGTMYISKSDKNGRYSWRKSKAATESTKARNDKKRSSPARSPRYRPRAQVTSIKTKRSSSLAPADCDYGKVRNPVTNRCITVGGKIFNELAAMGWWRR